MVVMPAMMPQPAEGDPTTDVCAVVLAAGEGRRLRPLTWVRPKPLCPVGGTPLVDHAVARARTAVGTAAGLVAVNIHHQRRTIEAYLAAGRLRPLGDVHVSVEPVEALGTAGALAHLRDWIDGRGVLVVNCDTWAPGDLGALTTDWDRERVRVLVAGDRDLRPTSRVVASWIPWPEIARLEPVPSGLEYLWLARRAEGRIDVVPWDGPCLDCGTPARYLAANMAASGGEPVVGEGAVVEGYVERAVVWPGARVRPGEQIVDAVRAGDGVTVLVR
jgi:NDP-sugar pyrophosphorylase family protein